MSVFDHDEAREITNLVRDGAEQAALVYAVMEQARYTAMLVDEQRITNLIAAYSSGALDAGGDCPALEALEQRITAAIRGDA